MIKRKSQSLTAVTLLLAVTGFTTYEKCEVRGCPGDANITAKVEAELARHAESGPQDEISVKTVNRVVYLSGSVSTGLMGETAESIASTVEDATEVENAIAVAQ